MSAEAAADLAVLEALGLDKVRPAEDAAADLVSFVDFRWLSVEPAADFADLLAVLLLKTLEAADAAFVPVFSVFLAI